jgi:tricorn protease-like protein
MRLADFVTRHRFLLLGVAIASIVLVSQAASASPGATERVSVDSAGNQANSYSSGPAISADGRYATFQSGASNLVPGDTNNFCWNGVDLTGNCPDVFVHDRLAGTTERVSVNSAGNQGNGGSGAPAISADGRYVTFQSEASNLVLGDTNDDEDVFVRDRQTGQTERVSVDSAGNQGNEISRGPTISDDGRYVAFDTWASNLVQGDTNGNDDVFVRDRQTGQTERVSVDSVGNQGNGESYGSAISASGRYVTFESEASNLVPGDTNGLLDVFVHDRQTGQTERVSVDSAGNQGNSYSHMVTVSADGRYVAFESGASNLVQGDTNGNDDVFVHDRQTGQTERVSVDSVGNQGNGHSSGSAISASGRYVAFGSDAPNLVPGDTNGSSDVFVHDRQTGQTERVSVDSVGNQGNMGGQTPGISADGRYVAFASWSSNLVPGDTNGNYDVFVHDLSSPVGGIAEYPDLEPHAASSDGGSAPTALPIAGLIAGGALLLAAGGLLAFRRRGY